MDPKGTHLLDKWTKLNNLKPVSTIHPIWLGGIQCVIFHVCWPSHSEDLWLNDRLMWQWPSEKNEKYCVVWSCQKRKVGCECGSKWLFLLLITKYYNPDYVEYLEYADIRRGRKVSLRASFFSLQQFTLKHTLHVRDSWCEINEKCVLYVSVFS